MWGKSLHNISNVFIVNLSACDLITATSIIPFDTDFILRGYYNYGTFICGLKETAFMFSLSSSIINLLLLTLERFIQILYPYKHKNVFRRINVVVMLLLSWSYYGVIALFPLMYNPNAANGAGGTCFILLPPHYVTYQVTVNFFMPLLCILVMNVNIFRIAGRHAMCIQSQIDSLRRNTKRHKMVVVTSFLANYKAAKTIMVLVSLFLICWLPYMILVTANQICNLCSPREVTWVGNAINYSSIIFNPVLYGLNNRRLRKVVTRNLLGCFQQNNYNSSKLMNRFTRSSSGGLTVKKECSSINVDNSPSSGHHQWSCVLN